MPSINSSDRKSLAEYQLAHEADPIARQAIRSANWSALIGRQKRPWNNEQEHYTPSLPAGWSSPAASAKVSACGCGGGARSSTARPTPAPTPTSTVDDGDAELGERLRSDMEALRARQRDEASAAVQRQRSQPPRFVISFSGGKVRTLDTKTGRSFDNAGRYIDEGDQEGKAPGARGGSYRGGRCVRTL